MVFARTGDRKFGLFSRKKAPSPDDKLAHVVSEVTAWKTAINR